MHMTGIRFLLHPKWSGMRFRISAFDSSPQAAWEAHIIHAKEGLPHVHS